MCYFRIQFLVCELGIQVRNELPGNPAPSPQNIAEKIGLGNMVTWLDPSCPKQYNKIFTLFGV